VLDPPADSSALELKLTISCSRGRARCARRPRSSIRRFIVAGSEAPHRLMPRREYLPPLAVMKLRALTAFAHAPITPIQSTCERCRSLTLAPEWATIQHSPAIQKQHLVGSHACSRAARVTIELNAGARARASAR